jgi:hypothetical protein
MPPENRPPALWLFRGALEDIERAALEACFGDAQTFRGCSGSAASGAGRAVPARAIRQAARSGEPVVERVRAKVPSAEREAISRLIASGDSSA